jgi:MoaA/NifB/PqqE/SkfB family radical SAM enzyme
MRIKYLVTATTGSLITNLKILRRYLHALVRHFTLKKLANILRIEWAYFRQNPVVNGYPYILKIESTNICNLRCPFCLDRDRGAFEKGRGFGRMTLDPFKKIIDVLGPYTIRINLYGSGEPVLFPEIYDMVRYAASRNIGVAISANLSNFNPADADRLLTCGLEHLIVSCHGATPASYLKYNVGGDFEKVMENMRHLVRRRRALKQKRPFIDWQFLLFSHNQDEVPLARKLGKEIGVDLIRFVLPNIPLEHKAEWRPRKPGEPVKKNDKPADRAPPASADGPSKQKGRVKVHRCSWPYRSIFFNWDGGILPCCHEQVDNEHDFGHVDGLDDFKSIWNNDYYQQARLMSNFQVHYEEVPLQISCVNCPMPKLPFVLHEKGFRISPSILKKIEPLMKEKGEGGPGGTR